MERDFKGVWIPRDLYLDKELSSSEKMLLVEIDSLDVEDDLGCYASNDHFAEILGQTVGSVKNMLSKLRRSGHVIEFKNSKGGRGLFTIFSERRPRRTRRHNIMTAAPKRHNIMTVPSQYYDQSIPLNTKSSDTSYRRTPGQRSRETDPVARRIWNEGIDLLVTDKRSESKARSMLGRLCRDYGNEKVAECIAITQAKNPVDPAEFLIATLRTRNGEKRNGNGKGHAAIAQEFEAEFAKLDAEDRRLLGG